MKKSKILVPALAMLVMSTAATVTGTVAWFSMNNTVTATGMSVTAKSNASYLLIGTGEQDIAAIRAKSGDAALTAAGTLKEDGTNGLNVYPTAKNGSTPIKNGETVLVAADAWYTASNAHTNNATDAVKNYQSVTLADNAYFVVYTLNLALTADSENFTGKITVTKTVESEKDEALSCYVIIEQGATDSECNLAAGASVSSSALDFTITNSAVVPVTVYAYLDGTSANVNTDYYNGANGAKLSGNIGLSFEISTVSA